jgi:hypothetical protein
MKVKIYGEFTNIQGLSVIAQTCVNPPYNLWVACNETFDTYDDFGKYATYPMLLDVDNAKELIGYLQDFINHKEDQSLQDRVEEVKKSGEIKLK